MCDNAYKVCWMDTVYSKSQCHIVGGVSNNKAGYQNCIRKTYSMKTEIKNTEVVDNDHKFSDSCVKMQGLIFFLDNNGSILHSP